MATTGSQTTTSTSTASIAQGAAVGIGLALVANLITFAIGNLGAPIQTVANGDTVPSNLKVALVIGASIVPLIVGAGGLWIFLRRSTNGFRAWSILVAVFAVASLAAPLSQDNDSGSKLALVVMHLATGAAAIAGHAIARRRTA